MMEAWLVILTFLIPRCMDQVCTFPPPDFSLSLSAINLTANFQPYREGCLLIHCNNNVAFEQNFTVEQFIRHWIAQTTRTPLKKSLDASAIRPSSEASEVDVWKRPLQVIRPKNHHHEFYDIQQIPWREKLRVGRSDARTLRDSWYTSYHNLTYELPGVRVPLNFSPF